MAGSLDKVLQSDGTYKWEVVEHAKEADEAPGELGISESAPEKGVLKGKETPKKVSKKKTDSPISE